MERRNWQREELLLALNLYHQLPFSQYHNRNPAIIQLSKLIDRSPDSIAMKLSNFASFDPVLQEHGVKGLSNAGRVDREIWEEFNANWNNLTIESEAILTGLLDGLSKPEAIHVAHQFSGSTEAERQVKVRLGQNFFRKMILADYGYKCCICGMPLPDLLIASHIVPWRDDESLRVNPRNGLCLCVVHDKGFDRGYITLGEAYQIIVTKIIADYMPNAAIESAFIAFEGKRITLPDKFVPEQGFLSLHRNKYFLG